MVFTVVAVVMGIGLAQPLVFKLGGDASAWRTMAIIFGGVCMVAMLATAFGVPRDFGEVNSTGLQKNMLERFSVVKTNRAYLVLTSAYLVQSIAQASGYAVVGFVFIYAIQDINLLLPFILVMSVGSILSQPFWLKISRQLGKENSFWIACIGWGLVTVTWLWVKPGNDVLLTLPFMGQISTEHALVLLRAFFIGITNSGFALLSFSMLTDTIEGQRKRDGVVDEGVFSGIFTAIEKLAFALGPLIAGLVLSFTGFESSVGGVVDQNASSIRGMVLCYSIVPTIGMAISLAIFTQYRRPI
jgi:GPH family glycoside/pentoside/hexuronide:cation symporter